MNCPAARHEYRHKAQEQYGRIRFHLGRLCHIGRMIAPNEQVLPMVGNFIFARPELLPGFLIKLNIKN